MGDENESTFVPVIFVSPRHPSLSIQPSYKDEVTGDMIGDHWTFEAGLFVCDTPFKLKVMEDFLKRSPFSRQLIKRASGDDEANNIRLKNMMKDRREKLAISGPFTSDVMSMRNAEVTELQLEADQKRMGVQQEQKEGDPPNEFAELARQLKENATKVMGPGNEDPI